ncbi:MAG: hypothetical protein JWO58_2239 [Chitinophagaceae bacterium]|nr:hypothetical protein [Chitinophagaceae bacterium]
MDQADTPDDSVPEKNPDFYIENGLYVFTEAYHLKRGTCCQNGCRHCPWKNNSIIKNEE